MYYVLCIMYYDSREKLPLLIKILKKQSSLFFLKLKNSGEREERGSHFQFFLKETQSSVIIC